MTDAFQTFPATPASQRNTANVFDDGRPDHTRAWAPETVPLGHPSPSSLRREILFSLRQSGPASPDQIGARLGASRTGVLQQLRALEATNLVSRQTMRHGVGRPRHLYDITTDAQDLFPSNYDGLAVGLIAAVRAVGGEELIEDLFAARRRQMGDRIRRQLAERLPAGAPLVERVRELAVIQDGQGYLCRATVASDGTVRLQEHNCAIFHVAEGNPAACQAELDLFRDVLGADVIRESHIAGGDRCCAYRIQESRRPT
ncbi:MAG TPA: metalloregulator ArsR/SmtB family transcription factor [Candidatus Saccharimonadales bacterium]|nr:metalloregulator ArsR/SmtB family transcription factor [Candidatus Saccharimonadales bacterium]